jgi:hypothetical protein
LDGISIWAGHKPRPNIQHIQDGQVPKRARRDSGSEDREGRQDSTVSVFTRDADGTLRHFYTTHAWIAPDIRERGIDLLVPISHFMDFTPQGNANRVTLAVARKMVEHSRDFDAS